MTKRRCGEPFPTRTVSMTGMPTRCNLPVRHPGHHYGQTRTASVTWSTEGRTTHIVDIQAGPAAT